MNVSGTTASTLHQLTPSSFGAPGYPGAPSLPVPRSVPTQESHVPTRSGDGNLVATAGFALVNSVVSALSVPGTRGTEARKDMSTAEIVQALDSARDAVALLTKGALTASDRTLGRNAGVAVTDAAEGADMLRWLAVDGVSDGNVGNVLQSAHQSFRYAQSAARLT